MADKTAKKTWSVRSIETREIIDTIEVDAEMTERQEERLLRGMLTNMDRDRFYVDTSDPADE